MNTNNSNSIGIIGGADGPTSIIISGNPILSIITVIIILLLITVALYLIFKKRPRK